MTPEDYLRQVSAHLAAGYTGTTKEIGCAIGAGAKESVRLALVQLVCDGLAKREIRKSRGTHYVYSLARAVEPANATAANLPLVQRAVAALPMLARVWSAPA